MASKKRVQKMVRRKKASGRGSTRVTVKLPGTAKLVSPRRDTDKGKRKNKGHKKVPAQPALPAPSRSALSTVPASQPAQPKPSLLPDGWELAEIDPPVSEKILAMVGNRFGPHPTVTLDSRIEEDLNADSLDTVELVMELEDAFVCSIPDEISELIARGTVKRLVLGVQAVLKGTL